MANILINAVKATTGGGKMILDNYIEHLKNSELDNNYFIVTPNSKIYKKYNSEKLKVINIPNWCYNNKLFFLLYYYKFPQILKKHTIDLVFNLGDVIIPTKIKQIYFFDWPYAVYKDDYIWNKMAFIEKVTRKVKLKLIESYIDKVPLVFAQTNNIRDRLNLFYNINQIEVLPTPVGINPVKCREDIISNLNSIKLFYPAAYFHHKNHQILFELARKIKHGKLNYTIYVTIDNNSFDNKIIREKLNDYIINLGVLNKEEMNCVYKNIDALLMPTLLETYGLPFYEAMAYEKPIITSDLDFARDACGSSAVYFDPFDSTAILNAIEFTFSEQNNVEKRKKKGIEIFNTLPTWEYIVYKFDESINIVLNED